MANKRFDVEITKEKLGDEILQLLLSSDELEFRLLAGSLRTQQGIESHRSEILSACSLIISSGDAELCYLDQGEYVGGFGIAITPQGRLRASNR